MQSKNLKCKALIVSLIYLICLNFGSLGAKVDNSEKFKKLTLKWRLIKNPENESGANKAAFIFINNGPETITTGEDGLLKANVAFPGFAIRYTEDGSEPNVNSKEYSTPIKVSGPIKVRSFNKFGRASKTFIVK